MPDTLKLDLDALEAETFEIQDVVGLDELMMAICSCSSTGCSCSSTSTCSTTSCSLCSCTNPWG